MKLYFSFAFFDSTNEVFIQLQILLAIHLLISSSILAIKAESRLFHASKISESLILSENVIREEQQGSNKNSAILKCAHNPWCMSVCELLDSKFTLTSLEISGGMEGIATDITCFTPKKKVLFPSSSVTLTGSPPADPDRNLANLKTGAYDGIRDSCFMVKTQNSPLYVLVEFPTITKITAVSVRSQPNGPISIKFKNFEVRVGNTSSPTDFSQNELLGKTTAGLTQAQYNIDILFNGDSPLYGKFVSIQELGSTQFQICMLEIF